MAPADGQSESNLTVKTCVLFITQRFSNFSATKWNCQKQVKNETAENPGF